MRALERAARLELVKYADCRADCLNMILKMAANVISARIDSKLDDLRKAVHAPAQDWSLSSLTKAVSATLSSSFIKKEIDTTKQVQLRIVVRKCKGCANPTLDGALPGALPQAVSEAGISLYVTIHNIDKYFGVLGSTVALEVSATLKEDALLYGDKPLWLSFDSIDICPDGLTWEAVKERPNGEELENDELTKCLRDKRSQKPSQKPTFNADEWKALNINVVQAHFIKVDDTFFVPTQKAGLLNIASISFGWILQKVKNQASYREGLLGFADYCLGNTASNGWKIKLNG